MGKIWQGFVSVFEAMGELFSPVPSRRHCERMNKILEQSQKAERWYHDGPWWEHPMYGDAWKDKDEKR